jgi:hypothetical protein
MSCSSLLPSDVSNVHPDFPLKRYIARDYPLETKFQGAFRAKLSQIRALAAFSMIRIVVIPGKHELPVASGWMSGFFKIEKGLKRRLTSCASREHLEWNFAVGFVVS